LQFYTLDKRAPLKESGEWVENTQQLSQLREREASVHDWLAQLKAQNSVMKKLCSLLRDRSYATPLLPPPPLIPQHKHQTTVGIDLACRNF